MDNGKRTSRFILAGSAGFTMIEVMVTLALTGVLVVGLLTLTKSKDSLTADSAEKYDSISSLMLPIKKLKRDIALANKVTLTGPGELEILTGVFRNNKLEEYTIVYKNATCTHGMWGISAASKDMKPESVNKIGSKKEIPCMVRINKSSKDQHTENFLGVQAVRWCMGGNNTTQECSKMETDMPEEFNNPGIKNAELSERRFMAEFIDRKNRVIAFTIDLGNLYEETLKDTVQITR